MKIIIEEVDKDYNYYEKLTFISKQSFDFKFCFVIQRLAVLSDQLTFEETENPQACIKLKMDCQTVNDFIKIRGYSKELSFKINDCFKTETFYFQSKLQDIARTVMN